MLQSTDSTPFVSQASSTLTVFPYLLIFTIKLVVMSTQSVKKTKRPRAVMTLDTKLKILVILKLKTGSEYQT
jgi:hypothetical protein